MSVGIVTTEISSLLVCSAAYMHVIICLEHGVPLRVTERTTVFPGLRQAYREGVSNAAGVEDHGTNRTIRDASSFHI